MKSYGREVGPKKFPNSLCLSLSHCAQGYCNSTNPVRLKGTLSQSTVDTAKNPACRWLRESCGHLSVMLNVPKELDSGFKVAQWQSPG